MALAKVSKVMFWTPRPRKSVRSQYLINTCHVTFALLSNKYYQVCLYFATEPPKPPAPVNFVTYSHDTISITWSASPNHNGATTSYKIYWKYTDKSTSALVQRNSASLTNLNTLAYTITGLPPDNHIDIQLTASNIAGESDKSNLRTVRTKQKSKPYLLQSDPTQCPQGAISPAAFNYSLV